MIMTTLKGKALESIVDFSKYEKSEDGFLNFLEDLDDLFSDKEQTIKDRIFTAGGYTAIFQKSDEYFESGKVDTVRTVTGRFLALASLRDAEALQVVGDKSDYRYKVAEQYNTKYCTFRYPSQFLFARTLVIENWELCNKLLHKTGDK